MNKQQVRNKKEEESGKTTYQKTKFLQNESCVQKEEKREIGEDKR